MDVFLFFYSTQVDSLMWLEQNGNIRKMEGKENRRLLYLGVWLMHIRICCSIVYCDSCTILYCFLYNHKS